MNETTAPSPGSVAQLASLRPSDTRGAAHAARPRTSLATVAVALVVLLGSGVVAGCDAGSEAAPGQSPSTTSPTSVAPLTPTQTPARTQVATPAGWSEGPLRREPATDGLMAVTAVNVGRHDGLGPYDEGLAFDRLAFGLTPGVGATQATRIGWDVIYESPTRLRIILRQAGAWRTQPYLPASARPGQPQIRSYVIGYENEGADLRVSVTIARQAPLRVVYLPDAEVVAVDVLHRAAG